MKNMDRHLKISIIVCVKNSYPEIINTLDSIINQNYKNLEIIVCYKKVNLNDKTENYLHSKKKLFKHLIKQKKGNIYTALNKCLAKTTGHILGMLHAGDTFANNKILQKINRIFLKNKINLFYGDILYIKKRNKNIIRKWKSGKFYHDKIKFGWMFPHTSMFMLKELYNYIGKYNDKYSISSDYDYIIRIMKNIKTKFYYLPKYIVKMETGGISNKNLKNVLIKMKQDYLIIKKNKIQFPLSVLFFKNLSKIKQFF